MTTAGWISLGLVIFGAFSYAAASILQAIGARRSINTVRAMGHPLYLIGIGCDILAWVGAMIALRQLAVYVVESILAGSLAVTVVAARVILKSHLRRRDVVAVIISVSALTVLALSAGPQQEVTSTPALRLGFCVAAGTMVLLGWVATKIGKPGLVAVIAGLSIGSGSLAGRALVLPEESMTGVLPATMAIITQPQTWALLTFAGTGMMLYANALQRGQVGPVTAVLWIAEVIAPSAVAVWLLGDNIRAGWALPAMIAALITVGAAVVLATAPANESVAAEAPSKALPAEPARHALPASLVPAAPPPAERIIWWGPSPIWIPPSRARPAVLAAHAPVPELTWAPPPRIQTTWPQPQRGDADTTEVPAPAPVRRPARRPWPEYYPPEPLPAAQPAPSAAQPWPWSDL